MSKRIELMFREYRNKERDIKLLRQRLMDMTCISDEEVIETMVFSSPEGEYVQSSGISDKTATIAMHFRDQQERLNKDMVGLITRKICSLVDELRLFDYAVALLPTRQAEIVRHLVKNGDDWETTMQELEISRRTLQRERQNAIDGLEHMYSLFDARSDQIS